MIRFRKTHQHDPMLVILQAETFRKAEERDFKYDFVWTGIDAGGNPAAFCSIRYLGTNTWYLSRAGVMPGFRGQGLQKKMIRLRVAHARRHGAKVVITDCTMQNSASANSLIGCGFTLYRPEYAWALPNSLYWRYDL